MVSSLNMLSVCIGLLLVAVPYVLCTASFSMELMHRDSPKSPLHDPTSTPSSRLDASIKRSASRADYLHSVNSRSPNSPLNLVGLEDLYAPLTSLYTEFIIQALLGLHYKPVSLVMDPGGSLVWITCDPCECYQTNLPKFLPESSDTYDVLSCESQECIDAGYRCDDQKRCVYTHGYVDNSRVTGILSHDSMTLWGVNGGVIKLKKMIFGCTNETHGHFPKESLGFMGLGGGSLSFVRQLGLRSYEMKFSYCLPAEITDSSRVYFGSSGRVSGGSSIHMDVTNLYEVTVDSITVGQATHMVRDKFVMDAGTFLTYMDSLVLANLIEMVKGNTNLPMIHVTPESTYKLCYSVINGKDDYKQLPLIKLNFGNGASFVLKQENAYVSIPDKNAMCLSIVPKKTQNSYSIIGSLAQVNHRIGFDLDNNMLSFHEESC